MINAIEVHIWNQLVGAVILKDNVGFFEYAPSFVKRDIELAPLMLPLSAAKQNRRKVFSFPQLSYQTYYGLPGFIADGLPDKFGNFLIDTYMAERGVDKRTLTPLDRLAYMGKRAMGALEFKPVLTHARESKMPLEMNELIKAARSVILGDFSTEHLRKNTLTQLIRVGTSAGGARAKAVIALHPKTNEILSGDLAVGEGYEHWLLKFDGMDGDTFDQPQTFGRIEYAYFLMAKQCGIHMNDCRLLEENGRAHFMTKRFDRDGNQKIHMQTLCGMYHLDFNLSATHSYQQLFRVINELRLGYPALEQAYRRMAFNVMACNCDDHTKNIAFLLPEHGKWQLGPAYDLSFAYNAEGLWTHSHQMSVNGKYNHITRTDLIAEADAIGIKKPEIILDEIKEVVSDWPQFAQKSGVSKAQIKEIESHLRLL